MKNLLLSVLAASAPLVGTTATWNLDANGNWNVNANWMPMTFPNAVDETANLFNVITGNRTITLGETITIGRLNIDSGFGYRVQGNQFIFENTGGTVLIDITNANGNAAHRISSPIQLNSDLAINQGSTSFFEIDGVISGTGGLIKNGSGTLRMDVQNNTYSGITMINEGTFDYRQRGAIPDGGQVSVGNGTPATLIINRSMSGANAIDLFVSTNGRLEQGQNDIVRLARVQGDGEMAMQTVNVQLFEILATAGDSSFSGLISGGSPSGSFDPNGGGRLLKSGSSRFTITGANNYTNRTFVGSGSQINVQNNAALGSSGAGSDAFTLDGGAIEFENGGGLTVDKRFRINGTGESSQGALRNRAGDNMLPNLIQVGWSGGSVSASDASIGVDGGTTLTHTGELLGSNNLTKAGTGILVYSGTTANNHTGDTTVSAGTLRLDKTGVTSINGDLNVEGGTVETLQTNQISTTSDVMMTSGAIDMMGNDLSIQDFTFRGGTLTQSGGTLSVRQLALRNVMVPGPLEFNTVFTPSVVFDAVQGGPGEIGDIDLGATTRTFEVNSGASIPDLSISGAITGAGGITKTAVGSLEFSGATPNTFTGAVSLESGDLFLNKAAGAVALPSDITVMPFTRLFLSSPLQIADTAVVTIDGGEFNLQGNDETISQLVFNSGTVDQSGGMLSLASTGNALTMSGVTIPGPVAITGGSGGSIIYNTTTAGAGSISNLSMGGVSRDIDVQNGGEAFDLVINTSTGSGFNKLGAGALSLIGTNGHGGSSVTVTAGELHVDGNLTASDVTTAASTTLSGNGLITAPVSLSGIVSPGSSIGTLTVNGDFTFNPGSTYFVELNPFQSDLLLVNGNVTIGGNTTLEDVPEPAIYPPVFSYVIISTPGGMVTGEFTNVTSNLPFFTATVTYEADAVILNQRVESFSSLITSGNAGEVARCLDEIQFEFPPAVVTTIPLAAMPLAAATITATQSPTIAQVEACFNQLQPSQLKGLALIQENNGIQVRALVKDRIYMENRQTCLPDCCPDPWNLWVGGSYDDYNQGSVGEEVAFGAETGTAILGLDYQICEGTLIGLAGAYSYSDLGWKEDRGDGRIRSGYGSIYGSYICNCFFFDLIGIGGYNCYDERREIDFTRVDLTARGSFDGWHAQGHFGLGYIFGGDCYEIRPYGSVDYVYLHQDSFKESGAAGAGLAVEDSNYQLLRSEAGVRYSYCGCLDFFLYYFDVGAAYIREDRFGGDKYRSQFLGIPDCTMVTKGLAPTRNLFSPSAGISIGCAADRFRAGIQYTGELGSHYDNHSLRLILVWKF